jgi:DHA2 family multidrug resistance protein
VPLTTAALSSIPRQNLTDATGLNSLLRQIGASSGLAIFATLLSRYAVQARHAIAAHLSPERPEVLERLAAMKASFLARGWDVVAAETAALQALDLTALRQAMVIAFERTFLLTGLVFLCVLPLLLLLKVRNHGSRPTAPIEVHAE